MKYGTNKISVLPVRSEPDHKSEMVNQLLFGEHFMVMEEKRDWALVKGLLDGYQGWITTTSTVLRDRKIEPASLNSAEVTDQPIRISLKDKPETSFLILPGSTLPNLIPSDNIFTIGDQEYQVHAVISPKKEECSDEKLGRTALIFLNAPYLWGGRSLFGIDCSGLIQNIYKICGIALPRDASQQIKLGTQLNFTNEARIGDLAFFSEAEEEISHVGMIIGEGKIIHASGRVRIDDFDHQGIFNQEKNSYSHNLRVIHRYLH